MQANRRRGLGIKEAIQAVYRCNRKQLASDVRATTCKPLDGDSVAQLVGV